jgi:hypothetical protein
VRSSCTQVGTVSLASPYGALQLGTAANDDQLRFRRARFSLVVGHPYRAPDAAQIEPVDRSLYSYSRPGDFDRERRVPRQRPLRANGAPSAERNFRPALRVGFPRFAEPQGRDGDLGCVPDRIRP